MFMLAPCSIWILVAQTFSFKLRSRLGLGLTAAAAAACRCLHLRVRASEQPMLVLPLLLKCVFEWRSVFLRFMISL